MPTLDGCRCINHRTKSACRALLDSVVEAADMRGDKYDNDKFNFSAWAKKALAPNHEELSEDDYWDVLFEVAYPIIKIRQSTEKLHELSIHFLDNKNVSMQFRNALNHLVYLCKNIERDFDQENFDRFNKAVYQNLPKAIIRVFPNFSDDFAREYPLQDYNDEEGS